MTTTSPTTMSPTTTSLTITSRGRAVAGAAGAGAVAGLAGAAVMVVTAKIEQTVTRRPNSYVPARALLTLLRQHPADDARPLLVNHLMHFGTGAAVGAVRGVWAATGIRGMPANAWHTVIRVGFDQTIENGTGVGAPPSTWPAKERGADVLHKTACAVVTGLVADRMLPPSLASTRGRTSH